MKKIFLFLMLTLGFALNSNAEGNDELREPTTKFVVKIVGYNVPDAGHITLMIMRKGSDGRWCDDTAFTNNRYDSGFEFEDFYLDGTFSDRTIIKYSDQVYEFELPKGTYALGIGGISGWRISGPDYLDLTNITFYEVSSNPQEIHLTIYP